jgi:hypothetical protein
MERLRRKHGTLIAAAAVHASIAAIIAGAVIPAVITDAFQGATPERAAPVLWGIAAANLMLALWYLAVGTGRLPGLALARWAWLIGLTLSLLFTAPLLDAALAYGSHGKGMQWASVALFGCTVGGAFSAVLVFVSHQRLRHGAGGV